MVPGQGFIDILNQAKAGTKLQTQLALTACTLLLLKLYRLVLYSVHFLWLRLHFAYSLNKVGEEFSIRMILLKLRMGKERWGTSSWRNILQVNQYTMTQSSTMTLRMFTLSYSNLWMLMWLDLLHYTPVEQLGPLVLTHLDGEGYVLHSRQHPLSSAIPLPWQQNTSVQNLLIQQPLHHSWLVAPLP